MGGPGLHAKISYTDVVNNGNGNQSRRGIARGHSGIYLALLCSYSVAETELLLTHLLRAKLTVGMTM